MTCAFSRLLSIRLGFIRNNSTAEHFRIIRTRGRSKGDTRYWFGIQWQKTTWIPTGHQCKMIWLRNENAGALQFQVSGSQYLNLSWQGGLEWMK